VCGSAKGIDDEYISSYLDSDPLIEIRVSLSDVIYGFSAKLDSGRVTVWGKIYTNPAGYVT